LKNIATKILILFFSAFLIFPPQILARVLICESNDNRYNYCPVKNNGNISIINPISSAECVKGSSWGYDRNGIWVNNGCRAEFEISFFDYGAGWGESGFFTCESQGFAYRYCPAFTGDGVNLTKQLSNEECVKDRSWGYDKNGIWVNNGCRGEFILNVRDNKGWHRHRHHHHGHPDDDAADIIGIIGGLALLGAIIGSAENSPQPPPPPPYYSPYYQPPYENRKFPVPDRLLGTFSGFSDFYKEIIEINIAPIGIIDGYISDAKIYGIYYNREELILNNKIFIIEQTSEGFIAKEKNNFNNQIYFKKIK
jgi:hypothetical protein